MAGWALPALAAGLNLFKSGSSALGSLMSYESAKKLQQHQYKIYLDSLRNAPSASREGFVKAGYNPLMALGSSQAGFSASSSGVGADLTSGLDQGINSAIAMKQSKAQIDNINADTALKNNQGETEKAKRVQMEFQNAMTDVETHLKQKDLSTYEKRFYYDLYEQMQRAENYRATSAVSRMNAETNRMNAQTQKYSNPFSWGHSALSNHAKSFEKDHPILSRTPYWKSYKNYIGK